MARPFAAHIGAATGRMRYRHEIARMCKGSRIETRLGAQGLEISAKVLHEARYRYPRADSLHPAPRNISFRRAPDVVGVVEEAGALRNGLTVSPFLSQSLLSLAGALPDDQGKPGKSSTLPVRRAHRPKRKKRSAGRSGAGVKFTLECLRTGGPI